MADDTVAATVETRKDAEDKDQPSGFWQNELKAAGKRDDKWLKRSKKIVERYRDEKERKGSSRVNVLWANTEILKASLFGGSTQPDVRRRYADKDPVARVTALMLERGLSYCLDDFQFDREVESALEDGLLAGRGYAREVYDPDLNEDDEIVGQKTSTKFIAYTDFRMSAGRRWRETWWIAFRHEMNRDQLKELNPEIAKDVPLNITSSTEENEPSNTEDTFKKAEVWEVWDKSRKERHWVVLGFDTILRTDPDPYQLEDFYPGPEPLTLIGTNDTMIPVPVYTLYQDQAAELDEVNARITKLTQQLKYRGVYPAGENQDGTLTSLMNADDGEFVPLRNWAAMVEKGGLKGLFQEVNLQMIIQALQGLYEQRAQILATIYEITGISDIMRGDVNPNEKLGQSNLKAQFGSLRMNAAQGKVNNFIRGLLRIKAELVAEHFTPEVLMEATGVQLPTRAEQQAEQMQFAQAQAQQAQAAQMAQMTGQPPPAPAPMQPPETGPTIDDVIELLRSDHARSYKIDIETAQTAMPAEQEQQSRLEFAQVMEGMMEKTLPMLQMVPSMTPFVKEMIMFVARGFKTGRQLEESLEDALDALAEQAMAPPEPPQPDPEVEARAAEAEMKLKGTEAQTQATLIKSQAEMAKTQMNMAASQASHQQKMEQIAMQGEANGRAVG